MPRVLGKFICNGKKLMIRSSLIRVGSDFNARHYAPISEKSAILRSEAVCFKG